MPSFEVTTPDGKRYRIDGAPDQATALQEFQKQYGGNNTAETPSGSGAVMAPTIPNRSVSEGVLRGLRDPIDAGAQLLTRGLAAGAGAVGLTGAQKFMQGQADKVDAVNREGETAYENTKPTTGSRVGRAVGNVLTTLPLFPAAAPETLGAAALRGIGEGAAVSALQPVDTSKGNYWKQKAEQITEGGATGLGGTALLRGAARVISPNVSPDLQLLLSKGVTPTIGQRLGGSFDRVEEALQNLPFAGDPIRWARSRALYSANRAAINDTLSPIGESLSKGVIGREAVKEAGDKISANYDKLVANASVTPDTHFATAANRISANAQRLPQQQRDQLLSTLKTDVFDRFQKGGITGPEFKDMESQLGQEAQSYLHSPDPDHRKLGSAFQEMQFELRDLLARSNPSIADKLQANNQAYANLLRVQGAASGNGAKEGVFTGAQLGSSVRSLDKSARKNAYARGEARMQKLSDAMQSVLGNKLPDSGTTPRFLVNGMALGGAPFGYMLSPEMMMAYGGLTAGSGAVYSPWGQAAINGLLTKRPQFTGKAADLIRSLRLPRGFAAYSTTQ